MQDRPDHLIVPESKDVLKQNASDKSVKGTRSPGANGKSSQWPKLEIFEQQNKAVLNYDSEHKLNIHESTLI